jgi:alanine-synthesizing transaminase
LILLADEIYDKILYDDAEHVAMAARAPDLLCLTFNGLSKAYRVAGFRAGWMVVSGPRRHARDYIEGLDVLANMRLCANVPAQHAIQAALGGRQSINDLVLPGGRLHEQRDRAWAADRQRRCACAKPKAPVRLPRLDPTVYPIRRQVRARPLLQGTPLSYRYRFSAQRIVRIVLPVDDLEAAIGRFGGFLDGYL